MADSEAGGVPGGEQEIVVRFVPRRVRHEVVFSVTQEAEARELLRKFVEMGAFKVELVWRLKVTEGVS